MFKSSRGHVIYRTIIAHYSVGISRFASNWRFRKRRRHADWLQRPFCPCIRLLRVPGTVIGPQVGLSTRLIILVTTFAVFFLRRVGIGVLRILVGTLWGLITRTAIFCLMIFRFSAHASATNSPIVCSLLSRRYWN